jgi:hypothetical protein
VAIRPYNDNSLTFTIGLFNKKGYLIEVTIGGFLKPPAMPVVVDSDYVFRERRW